MPASISANDHGHVPPSIVGNNGQDKWPETRLALELWVATCPRDSPSLLWVLVICWRCREAYHLACIMLGKSVNHKNHSKILHESKIHFKMANDFQ